MNLLLDTNILLYLIKDTNPSILNNAINPDNQEVYLSVASLGEIKSIALRNNWGPKKSRIMNLLLDDMVILEINENLSDAYAEIDAFSQRRNPSYKDYPFKTPRNMAKNDLWIAATAAFLGLKLVTTDADFDHLHTRFFEVERLSPEVFKPKRR